MPDFPSRGTNRAALQMLQGSRYNEPGDAARAAHRLAEPSSFKRGGKVKKSGLALVHKGERILRAGQVLGKRRKRKARKARR